MVKHKYIKLKTISKRESRLASSGSQQGPGTDFSDREIIPWDPQKTEKSSITWVPVRFEEETRSMELCLANILGGVYGLQARNRNVLLLLLKGCHLLLIFYRHTCCMNGLPESSLRIMFWNERLLELKRKLRKYYKKNFVLWRSTSNMGE
jgi:hypothetical protein